MSKKLFFVICLIISLFLISTRAKADQTEARIYLKERQLVFGDKVCERVLLKYAFSDCKYIDFEKGEKFENNPKCEALLKKRIECVKKAKRNEN